MAMFGDPSGLPSHSDSSRKRPSRRRKQHFLSDHEFHMGTFSVNNLPSGTSLPSVDNLPSVASLLSVDRLSSSTNLPSIDSLPSIAITHIFSFLTWREKLLTVAAIPVWDPHLRTPAAWPHVLYENEDEINTYFVREMREKFVYCMREYGHYIHSIRLTFAYKIGRLGVEIFNSIANECTLLSYMCIGQECYTNWENQWSWGRNSVKEFCAILQQCDRLSSVVLKNIFIDWSEGAEKNVIMGILNENLSSCVSSLELTSISLLGHEGYLSLVTQFSNLKVLVVRRDKVNNEILLELVANNLRELTLYQDEELSTKDGQELQSDFWLAVIKRRPDFRVDVVLRYIVIIRESFPAYMPLRTLILDDLANIVTKGVMDHVTQLYCDTLESFTYTNSFLESCETGDRRLPFALVYMVQKCPNLRFLHYGFPLSSTTILLIAQTRKLKQFYIPAVEVSYEFDWPIPTDWSPLTVDRLKYDGQSECHLENAVSELLGFDWTLGSTLLTIEDTLDNLFI